MGIGVGLVYGGVLLECVDCLIVVYYLDFLCDDGWCGVLCMGGEYDVCKQDGQVVFQYEMFLEMWDSGEWMYILCLIDFGCDVMGCVVMGLQYDVVLFDR